MFYNNNNTLIIVNRALYSSNDDYNTMPISSQTGRDVLKEGGNAVNACIASLICTGVVNLHST